MTLVAAHVEVPAPAAVDVVPVQTAAELADAVQSRAAGADVVVMAAAVADFRPSARATAKIKKSDDPSRDPVVVLERNPDVLAGLVAGRTDAAPVLVGFAAETGDGGRCRPTTAGQARPQGLRPARAQRGRGDQGVRATPTNAVTILGRDGSEREVAETSKDVVADAVVGRRRAYASSRRPDTRPAV